MTDMYVRWGIEAAAALLFVCTGWALVRYYTTRTDKEGKPMGLGWRAVQNMIAFMALPAILILSLEGILDSQITGGLIGALIGYALSSGRTAPNKP